MKPWKLLSEREEKVGYRRIFHRRFQMPNGREADFTVIGGEDVVCVLALTGKNEVVLARQFRTGPQQIYDELPGGAIDKGENPVVAAARELLEETGYQGELEHVATIPRSGYTAGMRHCFVATECKKVAEAEPEDHEFIELILKPMEEFVEQARAGQMTDVDVAYLGLHHLQVIS